MNKLPISAIILTYNEEKNIKYCIESIYALADEIFIVDSGSTDKTLEIAKKYTDKIYYNPFENYARQNNWALKNLPIKNEWLFHLDADERLSPELISELKEIFSSPIDADGFIIPRKTFFRGRWMRHGWHYPVYHLRIFRKNKGVCEDRLYDQHFIVKGKISEIKGDIINIINPDLIEWINKHKKWAYLEAREVLYSNNNPTDIKFSKHMRRRWLRNKVYYKIPLLIRPFLYFSYRYILKLGFLDGRQGLIFHFWQGFWYRFLVDLNIYKLRNKIFRG